jgi:hypothetical protein
VLKEESADDGARVDLAYRLALGRPASDDERKQVLDYVAETCGSENGTTRSELDAWANVCQAIFGTGEFLYVE